MDGIIPLLQGTRGLLGENGISIVYKNSKKLTFHDLATPWDTLEQYQSSPYYHISVWTVWLSLFLGFAPM